MNNLVILNKTEKMIAAPRRREGLYEAALALVLAHLAAHPRRLRPYVGWVHSARSGVLPYPPAFASRGLSLSQLLFVESERPARTLHALMQEDYFSAIVVDAAFDGALVHLGRRWLKAADQPQIFTAERLGDYASDKLLVLLDSSPVGKLAS